MGVTSQRPSAPAQPPPQCNSTARPVILWGWSRFPVCGLSLVVGDVGRSVAQSVEATPKRSKERSGRSQRLQGQSPKTRQRLERQSLKKSSRPGQPKAVGRVKASDNFAHKVQSTWPVQCGRTSEGFWHPVDLACPVWQDK